MEVGAKVKKYRADDRVLLPYAGPLDGYYSGWGGFSEYGMVWRSPEAFERLKNKQIRRKCVIVMK
jgi:hypothetical protein